MLQCNRKIICGLSNDVVDFLYTAFDFIVALLQTFYTPCDLVLQHICNKWKKRSVSFSCSSLEILSRWDLRLSCGGKLSICRVANQSGGTERRVWRHRQETRGKDHLPAVRQCTSQRSVGRRLSVSQRAHTFTTCIGNLVPIFTCIYFTLGSGAKHSNLLYLGKYSVYKLRCVYTGNKKRMWLVLFTLLSKMKDFSKSLAIT